MKKWKEYKLGGGGGIHYSTEKEEGVQTNILYHTQVYFSFSFIIGAKTCKLSFLKNVNLKISDSGTN